ncbi:hypothetical protein ILUMI_01309 [Ignelater luminosus]|uniref:Uncharacterized protein n=1 Tax=Ignelater luminosus TaxID=2038154 RepID=A0A8K0DKD0_IGNLU|nr:hypothetical protein ILUMI_01309 [Ignelater luminosus]
MTRETNPLIRKREIENGAQVDPSYHTVAVAKARCYLPGIHVTQTIAEVLLQSLLDIKQNYFSKYLYDNPVFGGIGVVRSITMGTC